MIIRRLITFRMRNISTQICRGNQNKFFISVIFLFENRAGYEIMLKSFIEAEQAIDDNMVHAHCMLDN